jgi:hypothetical protein
MFMLHILLLLLLLLLSACCCHCCYLCLEFRRFCLLLLMLPVGQLQAQGGNVLAGLPMNSLQAQAAAAAAAAWQVW